MLLRNSISNTKNFFRKTLQSFKSFFTGCGNETKPYQKLPKASPYYQDDLEKFYTEFTRRWDATADKGSKAKKKNKKKKRTMSLSSTQFTTQRREDIGESNVEKKQELQGYTFSKESSVAQKLKEIEMMDVSNVDHVLDVEEVLHYYSRLTCPAYVDIVDKFFMDLCGEFFGPIGSPASVGSRPKFGSVRQ
ncbi:uncharacterized protein LOC108487956 [Gossypium arboreum]|uniref:Uncharacterized protein n=1 Tax=Gossypium arboreum TaxID=29729 RepID=A0ABR0P790_GOSAR|nr:uncharacterized protein LOC108487956 [Gossypium arboreum]KAK5817144.1 hypothetical protein PVK06_022067 [Gossypium arboreum]